jgi:hypothetical protein
MDKLSRVDNNKGKGPEWWKVDVEKMGGIECGKDQAGGGINESLRS